MAFAASVGQLVGAFGNGHRDAAAGEQAAVGGRGVTLVPEQPVGSGAGSPKAAPGDSDLAQCWAEHDGVVDVAAGQPNRQGKTPAVADQVQRAGKAAPRAAQSVISGFV